jgi:hypothetical protein
MSGKSNEVLNLRLIPLGIIAALAMILFGGTTLAQINLDETKNIGIDMYYEISLTGIEAGEVLNVNIQVTKGGPVDVLLMKSSDYVKYLTVTQSEQGGIFNYYVDGSSDNIKSKTYSFTFPENGDYYLVIDNTVNPIGGANPAGAVDVHAKITVVSQAPTQNRDQGIVDNANRLNDDYKWKLDLVIEIQKRTDALGTAATKEMYIEWKLRNKEAIESGERLASYITENRNVLNQKWVSDALVLIANNKVTFERDNQNLEQLINSPQSPGFEAILTGIGIILVMVLRRR